MRRSDVLQLLIGKTIKSIEASSYLMWPLTVQSITFTDGTVIELGGNADEARIYEVSNENGLFCEDVEFDDKESI